MSIYATLWMIKIQDDQDNWHEIWGQGVPGHIDYTGEKWSWLPPPIANENSMRAVVVVTNETRKGTPRCGQEYQNPLFILSGEEHARMTWMEMLDRIEQAILQPAIPPSCARCGKPVAGMVGRYPYCAEHLSESSRV